MNIQSKLTFLNAPILRALHHNQAKATLICAVSPRKARFFILGLLFASLVLLPPFGGITDENCSD
ncbi:hypothetical protein HMPREF0454_02394 [Hafnia alvei ATCC 51873]|uniref:Uncharacterized protein n=1 Tax=Hafnia alvei ATCC 51873 TaxID=1002364 RepID=G9Y740_HAFAL|nr:hypothetical protein HMPREF0454_02394 [Hafnia alvei ATCC 51873]